MSQGTYVDWGGGFVQHAEAHLENDKVVVRVPADQRAQRGPALAGYQGLRVMVDGCEAAQVNVRTIDDDDDRGFTLAVLIVELPRRRGLGSIGTTSTNGRVKRITRPR
jgi:hypothetical protein